MPPITASWRGYGSELRTDLHECPCGYHGDPKKQCSCSPSTVTKYQRRISGPLLDRIDMFTDVPSVEYEELVGPQGEEGSLQARARIDTARSLQRARFQGTSLTTNSEMGPAEVWRLCPVEESAKGLLQAAMKQLNLSARAFHRVLKLAMTIADLSGAQTHWHRPPGRGVTVSPPRPDLMSPLI